jgi:hypothetical protein
LIDKVLPRLAAMVDDIAIGFEDIRFESLVAQELPDALLRVELRTFRRQRDQGDVRRHNTPAGEMPAGPIDEQRGVSARRNLCGDFGQMQVHGFGVASGLTRAAPLPCLGQIAAKIEAEAVRWSVGALGRVPRLARRWVILFFLADPPSS